MSGRAAWLDACRADREARAPCVRLDGRPAGLVEHVESLDMAAAGDGERRAQELAAKYAAEERARLADLRERARAYCGADPGGVPDPYAVWGRDPEKYDWLFGYDRVRAAIAGAVPGTVRYARFTAERLDCFSAGAASYWTAAAVCAVAKNPELTGRFALNEAKHAERVLWSSLKSRDMAERDRALAALGELVFGGPGPIAAEGGRYLIPVGSYLQAGAADLGDLWRLVNVEVHAGTVQLGLRMTLRLARKCVMEWVRDCVDVRRPSGVEVPADVAAWCRRRAAEAGARAPGDRTYGDIAPCVAACRAKLADGQNLNHMGRFFLAAHCAARGMNEDSILDMFRLAPDFSESKSRYYIRNIIRTGRPGGPGCDRIKSWNLCPGPCGAKHPLHYRAPADRAGSGAHGADRAQISGAPGLIARGRARIERY